MSALRSSNLTPPPLSRRAESLGTENAFVVLAEVNALQRAGKDIVSFCIGQPDFPTPSHVQDAAIDAIRGGKHGYTPSAGIDELRAVAAKDLGARRRLDIAADDVVIGAGAKPFIAYTIASVTDYGTDDEVIYPVPGFPIYESQILANGAVPVPIYLRESRHFAFDPAELEAKITPKTRLLILNTPQNPTGGILTGADLDAIAEILRGHPQVWVYADEIYSRLVYDGRFDSIATRPGMLERTVISDGASKTWAMTGWRIGYAANRTLAPVLTRWITNTESCASQISQWAAIAAIAGPQDAAEAMRARFLERRDLIVRLLNDVPGVTCAAPGGAFYAWPNVTEACRLTGCADSEEFRKRLLNEAGVAVLADIHFGRRVPGDGQHIRFSYATSNEAIEEGIARLAAFVRKGKGARGALTQFIADNKSSRDAVLARVRKALGRTGSDTEARARADAYVAAHGQGPRPSMPGDLVERFMSRAGDMASTVERVASVAEVPARVARYIEALRLPERIASQRATSGVCWPEFAGLDWAAAGLAIEARPTVGHDKLAITGCFCAIAETGTLVFTSGADTPTSSALLPDTHVAVLHAGRIVSGMEEAFALVRKERQTMPRAINLISGPSRTGDIEQTIVLGAHGPYRVHILVV